VWPAPTCGRAARALLEWRASAIKVKKSHSPQQRGMLSQQRKHSDTLNFPTLKFYTHTFMQISILLQDVFIRKQVHFSFSTRKEYIYKYIVNKDFLYMTNTLLDTE
jgi:hypothetical protein